MDGSPLLLDLMAIRAIDQHAHGLLRPDELASFDYRSAFTEAVDDEAIRRHAPETLFFRRSVREIADVLGCEPQLDSVLEARAHIGFEEVARRFFAAAGLQAMLLDDGFESGRVLPVSWHSRFAPAFRLLRIERLAEELVETVDGWAAFQELFRAGVQAPEAVGLKSIVAYRTGLAVEKPDLLAAAACFEQLRQQYRSGVRVRLGCKPLNDWVVWTALSAAVGAGMPVQFHTGFGDPDLDLRWANPLHLRPLLEHPPFAGVPVVLLHASYPFMREAGYLASVYANVFVDFGLAIPTLSVSGMSTTVRTLLELAPISKILFASDAHFIPELFYLGARWGRRVLANELESAVRQGDLTTAEADAAAEKILRDNAASLYQLPK